jgi:hypothetical protein
MFKALGLIPNTTHTTPQLNWGFLSVTSNSGTLREPGHPHTTSLDEGSSDSLVSFVPRKKIKPYNSLDTRLTLRSRLHSKVY